MYVLDTLQYAIYCIEYQMQSQIVNRINTFFNLIIPNVAPVESSPESILSHFSISKTCFFSHLHNWNDVGWAPFRIYNTDTSRKFYSRLCVLKMTQNDKKNYEHLE